jgi:small subunit ribosomal protein S6
MAKRPPTYDLVLLLDQQAQPDARAKVLVDARAAIEAKGKLVTDADWGDRTLTYPIRGSADAHYHLLQFHADTPELLSELDRTLRITDEVVRFRIVKLAPGVPEPPDMRTGASSAPARHEGGASSAAPAAAVSPPAASPPAASPPPPSSPPAASPPQPPEAAAATPPAATPPAEGAAEPPLAASDPK